MYLKIILLGVGILVLFRMLSFLNKALPFAIEVKHYTSFVLPFIELLTWLGFIIWSVRVFYDAGAFSTLVVFGIVILVLLVPSWFLIRDFLFGKLLVIQRKIELNSHIEAGEISGEIIKIEHFSFDVKTKNGNIDTIPYNKIRSKIISKTGENTNLEKQLISFDFSAKYDVNDIVARLKVALLNSPWVAASQNPIVNNISLVNERHVVEVFVYLLKKDYTEKIREYVKRNFVEESLF